MRHPRPIDECDETWDVCIECGAVEQGWTNGYCNSCGELDPDHDGEPADGAWPNRHTRDAAEIREDQAYIQRVLKR
jgi:hypothetical protein